MEREAHRPNGRSFNKQVDACPAQLSPVGCGSNPWSWPAAPLGSAAKQGSLPRRVAVV